MNTPNKQFIERYFAAISGEPKPVDVVQQYVSDPELEDHIALFEKAFPKYELSVEDMVAEEDKVAVRATFRGTQRGEFYGIAPTGKSVGIPVMLVYRIADGKIVEHWMNADSLGLMQQLGAIPS